MAYFPNLNPNCTGCPTLAFEVEGNMVDENPLLITSLSNPGIDVTDYYMINTSMEPDNNEINFVIHEPETEHTWLDFVELIEAKVKNDEMVAVTDEGEVINYKKSTPPVTVLLNDTTDITQILSDIDTLDISLSEGDVLTVHRASNLPEGDGGGDVVISGEEPNDKDEAFTLRLAEKNDVYRGIKSNEKENPPLGGFFFRKNKSIIAKNLKNFPPGNLEITISKDLRLDYLAIVKNIKTATIKSPDLLNAYHDQQGDVKELLSGIDQNYAEIYPGDIINFTFESDTDDTEKKSLYNKICWKI